jgi:hypothetical protein
MYIDEVYKQLVKEVLTDGVQRDTRNGKTLSVFGTSIKFDMAETGLPLLSYRKIFTKGVVGEFLGFLQDAKTVEEFEALGCPYWKLWADKNGKLELDVNYNDEGKEDGTVKYYYPNGQEEFVYEANNGVPKGKAIRYYENGDVKEVIYYASDGSVEKSEQKEMVSPSVKVVDPGASKEMAPKISSPRTKGATFKPNAYNKVYNQNDEIWQDGDFRNGRLWSGKVYEYDSDGILLKVKVFKNGVYHSDGQL